MSVLPTRSPLKLLIEWSVVAGLYVLSAQITPHLSISYDHASPLSAPTAIALTAGLVLGYRGSVGVWLGALLVGFQLLHGPFALAAASALATGAALQMLAATLLIRRFIPDLCVQNGAGDPRRSPSLARDILFFIGMTALTSLIAPSIATTTLRFTQLISANDMGSLWLTWWVSDYAGILTLTPLLMVIILAWRRRDVIEPIVFPITTVWLGLSLVVSYLVWQNKTFTANDQLRQDVQELARQFEKSSERIAERLQAVEGFMIAVENVRSNDFRKFLAQIGATDKNRGTVQWVPKIKIEERAQFESRARKDGSPNFTIFEWTATGERIAAASRPEYFPILFSEPLADDTSELGLDLSSIADIFPVLNTARDTDRATAAYTSAARATKTSQRRLFLYNPIFADRGDKSESVATRREKLRGFLRIELPITELINTAGAGAGFRNREIYLFDVTEDEEPLYLTSPGSSPALPHDVRPGAVGSAKRLV